MYLLIVQQNPRFHSSFRLVQWCRFPLFHDQHKKNTSSNSRCQPLNFRTIRRRIIKTIKTFSQIASVPIKFLFFSICWWAYSIYISFLERSLSIENCGGLYRTFYSIDVSLLIRSRFDQTKLDLQDVSLRYYAFIIKEQKT